ncbi:SCO2523 family variant P-loop protein [Yinghuangia sp. YIM S09857]|uniref:SCO2523 family variant P-loop protein n=1 Tax=Yinghuangia sp. YIM S09857 TaxID=3436929 RepID=UPI003F53606C
MLIVATSDKGGAGRSVSIANIAYRRALQGDDVCYADFDFGSATGAHLFEVVRAQEDIPGSGLHSYLQGRVSEPKRIPVWTHSKRQGLRRRLGGAGRLTFFPGDEGGGELAVHRDMVHRCAELVLQLDEEFDVCFLDVSSGRSYALDLLLEVTALPALRSLATRWLVFHRWTHQHIAAAAGLVYGPRGLLAAGAARGHDPEVLRAATRFVRAAVVDPVAPQLVNHRPGQAAWARACDQELRELASELRAAGPGTVLGSTPLEPLLQWREQLVTDDDVHVLQVANRETVEAFAALAHRLTDDDAWEGT